MNRTTRLPFLFLLAALAFPAAAQDFRPRFEAGSGLVAGTSYELVLRDGTYDHPVSQLTWPVPPSVSLDLAALFPWMNWTSTSVALRALKPLGQGTMIDEDWDVAGYYGLGNDLVYARSTHEAFLTAHYTFQAEQDFVWGPWTLSAGGIYRWMTWEGWNGQGKYKATQGTSSYTFSGLLIAYRQEWSIPYVGASWTWDANGWSATPSIRFSPYTWCSDMDNHNYAGSATKTYLDQLTGGSWGQVAIETAFPGGSDWTWGVRGGVELAWGAIGDTVTTYSVQSEDPNPVTYTPEADMAGGWFTEASLTLFVRN